VRALHCKLSISETGSNEQRKKDICSGYRAEARKFSQCYVATTPNPTRFTCDNRVASIENEDIAVGMLLLQAIVYVVMYIA
jgi:hypothetical protein